MLSKAIGTTKGPGETPHEFLFVTPDPDGQCKFGEYVYYETAVGAEKQEILGRITGRTPLRQYPDNFLADPAVPPAQVAELLGLVRPDTSQGNAADRRGPTHELFEITTTILGYYDRALGFVNPRIPPRAGESIYIASDEQLAEVLGRLAQQEIGAIHIGSLLSRDDEAVPIVLDARGFTSTHLAIIASTGSGKSYLAGVILEELMMPHNRAAVLVIDPHGEYDTLLEMRGAPEFAAAGYRADVEIKRPEAIKVRINSLTIGDLSYLLPNLSEKMYYALRSGMQTVQRKYGDKWTVGQLKVAIRQGGEAPETDPDADEEMDPTIGALMWRIGSVLENSRIFQDHVNLPLSDLLKPGQCTVLQLNGIAEREQQIIVATLLRRINQARMDTVRQLSKPEDDNYLAYPAFVLIEEAHNYAPAGTEIITTRILKQILSEGRKFGVAVGLISQRPGKLDGDVLSQCMTQCIMRIVNPIDQARIAESVESVGRDLLRELPALTKGQVIVAGASVNTPVLARVRKRITSHGAEDPDSPSQWQAYFAPQAHNARLRDEAPPADNVPPKTLEELF